MSKILKNVTAFPITIVDVGSVTIAASPGSYTIPPQDYELFAVSSNTVTFVGAASIVVNDGSFDLTISDGIDLIKGLYPRLLVFTPIVQNVSLPIASTEVTHVLPTNTRRYMLHNRGPGTIKLAFTALASGTTFFTIHRWAFVTNGLIGSGTITLYLQSPVAGTVAEIESWT